MMAAEKRPASNAFGSSQLVVKRQKSNVDLSDGNATGRTVMQAVSLPDVAIDRRVLNEGS